MVSKSRPRLLLNRPWKTSFGALHFHPPLIAPSLTAYCPAKENREGGVDSLHVSIYGLQNRPGVRFSASFPVFQFRRHHMDGFRHYLRYNFILEGHPCGHFQTLRTPFHEVQGEEQIFPCRRPKSGPQTETVR